MWLNVNWNALRNSFRSRAGLQTLEVAGLPVTCSLTLPIACVACNLDRTVARANFEYKRYNGWPEVKEWLISGQVNAAYMLAPLVMDLVTKDVRSTRSYSTIKAGCTSAIRKIAGCTGRGNSCSSGRTSARPGD